MIDVFVWNPRPGHWKAFAPSLGLATSASTRSEALRQMKHEAHAELGDLRIIGTQPDGESMND
jgi:hypothetical protein